jgi:hypothetical protein
MTDDERWDRIEEKHLALAESLELLTHNVHALQESQRAIQQAQERLDQHERAMRKPVLDGVVAFLRRLDGQDRGV